MREIMLNASDAACAFISDLLTSSDAPDDSAVRFVIEENNLSMKLDEEKPGDESFHHEGKTVLVVDAEMSQILDGKTLDVEETEEGPQLTMK